MNRAYLALQNALIFVIQPLFRFQAIQQIFALYFWKKFRHQKVILKLTDPLKDRTLLSKQLTDLRRKQRVTMTNTEREDMMTKIKDLEDELAMQNVQISELQKQIMDADAQENDNQGSR